MSLIQTSWKWRSEKTNTVRRFLEDCFISFVILWAILFVIGVCSAQQIHIKVEKIDTRTEQVQLLLPMHNTQLDTKAQEKDDLIRITEGLFYPAQISPGKIGTTKRSVVKVEGDYEEPVTLTIRRIVFR